MNLQELYLTAGVTSPEYLSNVVSKTLFEIHGEKENRQDTKELADILDVFSDASLSSLRSFDFLLFALSAFPITPSDYQEGKKPKKKIELTPTSMVYSCLYGGQIPTREIRTVEDVKLEMNLLSKDLRNIDRISLKQRGEVINFLDGYFYQLRSAHLESRRVA